MILQVYKKVSCRFFGMDANMAAIRRNKRTL